MKWNVIRTLIDRIASILYVFEVFDAANTLSGLSDELKSTVQRMQQHDVSVASVHSASELFLTFITLTSLDQPVSYLV